ncbi:hypothetical protein CORC01_08577, partial [Colletotrichum orchidophilum]
RTCDFASGAFRTFKVAFAFLETLSQRLGVATRDFYVVLPRTALDCQTSSAHPGRQQPMIYSVSLANPFLFKCRLGSIVSNCISKKPLAEVASELGAPDKPHDAPEELDPDPSKTRASPAPMQVIGGNKLGEEMVVNIRSISKVRLHMLLGDWLAITLLACRTIICQRGWLRCLAALHAPFVVGINRGRLKRRANFEINHAASWTRCCADSELFPKSYHEWEWSVYLLFAYQPSDPRNLVVSTAGRQRPAKDQGRLGCDFCHFPKRLRRH